jgi:hypothetical protein
MAAAIVVAPVGAAAAGTGQATTSASATATNCTTGVWPSSVQGRPLTFRAGATGGEYLWHDLYGWHVRVTHPGSGRVVFTGVVVSSAPLAATPVKLEPSDVVTVSTDRKTITFRLVNFGGIDGFDFRTACATSLGFGVRADGIRLPTWRIFIGRYDRHPLENPFAIRRVS